MAKFTGHFSPTEVSRVVDVGAPGGTSGNFQSRARTSGSTSHPGPVEEEEVHTLMEQSTKMNKKPVKHLK
jgi:hypothetical protein